MGDGCEKRASRKNETGGFSSARTDKSVNS